MGQDGDLKQINSSMNLKNFYENPGEDEDGRIPICMGHKDNRDH